MKKNILLFLIIIIAMLNTSCKHRDNIEATVIASGNVYYSSTEVDSIKRSYMLKDAILGCFLPKGSTLKNLTPSIEKRMLNSGKLNKYDLKGKRIKHYPIPIEILSREDSAQRIIDLRILRKAILWDYLPEGSTTDDITVHIRQLMSYDGRLDGFYLNDTIN